MFVEKNHKNIVVQLMNSPIKLFIEIYKNIDEVLKTIFDICIIYIKYLIKSITLTNHTTKFKLLLQNSSKNSKSVKIKKFKQ